jgi:hypothetical protein
MMHLEICVEDASGKIFLENILPRVIRNDVSWRVHGYRGIGRIPKGLQSTDNAEHRIILDNLPKLIRGCANTPHVTALIIVIDSDQRDCEAFLKELKDVHNNSAPNANVIFRLAIEEMEAWILGDRSAIEAAYPKVTQAAIDAYSQDTVCGTWEVLADAIHPGGSQALIAAGWPAPGAAKCDWAANIPPHMDLTLNKSPSFNKFLEALAPFC